MYDMAKLKNLKTLDESAPAAAKAFHGLAEAVFQDGALAVLQKELIAVAVALTTQCPYCLELHVQSARKAGATDAQLAETALVAATLRAGSTVTHATHMFKG